MFFICATVCPKQLSTEKVADKMKATVKDCIAIKTVKAEVAVCRGKLSNVFYLHFLGKSFSASVSPKLIAVCKS